MADVQLEHGYLRLANRLATAIALAPWGSPSHPRIVMALIRATYGLRRREAPIGAADWRAFTGLSDRHIRRAKLELADAGVIVLVADFDARTHTPQTWMLQKNFTKWGPYSVSEADVEAAEQAFTAGLTPGPQAAPPDTDGRGDPRTQTCGDQGTQMDGDQGTQIVGGTGSNPAADNELQRRKTGKTGKTGNRDTLSATDVEFERFREAYPKRSGDQRWREARRAWNARLREGAEPEAVIAAACRYAAYVRAEGNERTKFVKQAATFLGDPENISNPWTISRSNGNGKRATPQQFAYNPTESFQGFNP